MNEVKQVQDSQQLQLIHWRYFCTFCSANWIFFIYLLKILFILSFVSFIHCVSVKTSCLIQKDLLRLGLVSYFCIFIFIFLCVFLLKVMTTRCNQYTIRVHLTMRTEAQLHLRRYISPAARRHGDRCKLKRAHWIFKWCARRAANVNGHTGVDSWMQGGGSWDYLTFTLSVLGPVVYLFCSIKNKPLCHVTPLIPRKRKNTKQKCTQKCQNNWLQ